MFIVIRRSYINLESQKQATLDYDERGFDSMCSDKIRFVRTAMVADAGLPG